MQIYSINPNYFNEIDSHEKAYVLGFIAADGSILHDNKDGRNQLSIGITESDRSILESIRACLSSNHPMKLKENVGFKSYKSLITIAIRCKQLTDDLLKHGIVPNKSLILEFPKTVPNDYINSFILGYFDGDGSWTYWKQIIKGKEYIYPVFEFYSGSYQFLESTREILVSRLELKNNKIYTGNQCFQIRYSGISSCNKLYKFMYQDSPLCLLRKRTKIENLLNPPKLN